MIAARSWQAYKSGYRSTQVKTLANWALAGVSGSVVGLAGAGKSNVLGFVCHRPDAVQSYLPPDAAPLTFVPVDLNNLPSNSLATFYRVILRAFYEIRQRFEPPLQATITGLYRENRTARDPFLPQSALRELLLDFQSQGRRVVLVLDRFDGFCQIATPQMLDTLRGLRDSFKDALSYIVGTRQAVAYLFDPATLGEIYEILDSHVCWVGPMSEADARQLIYEETHLAPTPPAPDESARLLALTGGYPALLKAACYWWHSTANPPPLAQWGQALLAQRGVQSRLDEIWSDLTQEERQALTNVADNPGQLEKGQPRVLAGLEAKGLCRTIGERWQFFGELFAAYVTNVARRGSGRIWLDEQTGQLYQGQTPLRELTPMERSLLEFFLQHPRSLHTKTDLIENTWPDDVCREGVTDESLYQVIRGLRKKVEPTPAKPCYVVTWRGRPGGYQFFPEGRPG